MSAVCWACGHVHRDENGCGAGPKPEPRKTEAYVCKQYPNHHCIHPGCAPPAKEKVVVGDFGSHPYVALGAMADEIRELINGYVGRVSLAETIGVLEIVKLELFARATNDT